MIRPPIILARPLKKEKNLERRNCKIRSLHYVTLSIFFIISVIFLFIVPLEGMFSQATPLVMAMKYECYPLLPFLLSPLVPTSTIFEGDFPLGDSSLSLLPLLKYSVSRPFLITPLNGTLSLDAIISVMIVTLMEVALLRLISASYFSDMVRKDNFDLLKLGVRTILKDILVGILRVVFQIFILLSE